jgi:hypothetical protein
MKMPPWMQLPEEVRRRVVERLGAHEASPEELTRHRTDLIELSMFRLIEHFEGDVGKAIVWAREHQSTKPEWGYPSWHRKDWRAAHTRVRERIAQMAADPEQIAKGYRLFSVVQEEMARYASLQ